MRKPTSADKLEEFAERKPRPACKLMVLAERKSRPAGKLMVLAECKPRTAGKGKFAVRKPRPAGNENFAVCKPRPAGKGKLLCASHGHQGLLANCIGNCWLQQSAALQDSSSDFYRGIAHVGNCRL